MDYFSAVPPRSTSPRCRGGVLHRRALKESFCVPSCRSASTTHLGGVHHLADLVEYIRVWFLGRCSPIFLLRTSPAEGFLRALHLRAFCSTSSFFFFGFFLGALAGLFFPWNSTTAGIFGLLTARPRRSGSSHCPGGVLHRAALEEFFSAQPLRSASTTHLGGVHHLAELVEYIRICFFGRCSPLFVFFVPLQCGAFWEQSTVGHFWSSPHWCFLEALRPVAF